MPGQAQNESALMEKREQEMKEYIERFYEQEETTPSFERIMGAYSDYYNKSHSHPKVMSDVNQYAQLIENHEEMTEFEKTVQYFEFAGVFALEAQDATIGAVSGNLSNCQGNVSDISGKVKLINDEYANETYAKAGQSTYEVLASADPIIYSCFFSFFEYSGALESYVETISDG